MTTDAPKRHAPKGRIKARPDDPKATSYPKASYYASTCTATSKTTGARCGRPPILGGRVCRYHGGKAPQVQKKAEERLLEMQPTALRRLNELMEQGEFPSVAIAATRDVLDRTMGKALERAEVGKPGDFRETPDEELRVRIAAVLAILDAS